MNDWLTKDDVEHLKQLLRKSKNSSRHIEVEVITEWKTELKEKVDHEATVRAGEKRFSMQQVESRKIASTEKRTLHKDLISEAKKHEGFCVLKLADGETITVTESYEDIARELCPNNQEN